MIRASIYLAFSGVIWLAEGFIFSRFLRFSAWQTALMAVLYVGLFGIAVSRLVEARQEPLTDPPNIAEWRILTIAPMVVVIVGSFVSLPLLLVIVAIGKAIHP